MQSIKKFHQQSGFAMLEVVLAIVIIAIASFGIYKLYNSATVNSKLSAEEDLVSQIYSAATQMSFNNSLQPTTEELFNSGAFDTDIWSNKDKPLRGPFGDITYAYDTSAKAWSSITASNIPGSVASQFAAHMQKWGDVYIDDVAYASSGSSMTDFSQDDTYTITVYFPQNTYVPSSDGNDS